MLPEVSVYWQSQSRGFPEEWKGVGSRCLDERFTKADQVSGHWRAFGARGEDVFKGLLGLLPERNIFFAKRSFKACWIVFFLGLLPNRCVKYVKQELQDLLERILIHAFYSCNMSNLFDNTFKTCRTELFSGL